MYVYINNSALTREERRKIEVESLRNYPEIILMSEEEIKKLDFQKVQIIFALCRIISPNDDDPG